MKMHIKYWALFALLTVLMQTVSAQNVYTINADSVKLTDCDSSELIIENHTQNVPGFLFNTGKGRTIFRRGAQKLNDSLYLIGADTLNIKSNPWVQGGNAFGATGILGTADLNPLDLYTNNAVRARLHTNGDLILGAITDSGYKLDVKGAARFGDFSNFSTVRGSLNFDNNSNLSFIMEQGNTARSIQIPGTGGASPWVFNNDRDMGISVVDASGTVNLQGGTMRILSSNFFDVGTVISTEPSSFNNRTIYIGNTNIHRGDEKGTNIDIRGGTGGFASTNVYSGGDIRINPGQGGARGPNGNVLLGNLIGGNVGIQTSTPLSNFEVDQSTTGSGVVSNAASGTTVTGLGTLFTNTFNVGDSITIAGQTVAILTIASDVSMTTDPISLADTNVSYSLAGGSRFHVKGNGNVGIGTSSPSSRLDISGPAGYSQLRIRASYTPSSSSDPKGNVGDMAWDDNYIYVKTSVGWKRSTLSSF